MVAAIIASLPGFASIIRLHVSDYKLITSLRSLIGGTNVVGSHEAGYKVAFDPNVPHTGRENVRAKRSQGQKNPYYELNDSWAMNTRAMVEAESGGFEVMAHDPRGVTVFRTIDVERSHASWEETQNGLVYPAVSVGRQIYPDSGPNC